MSESNIVLKQLFFYVKPYFKGLIGVLVGLLMTSGSILAIGKIIRFFIDNGVSNAALDGLNRSLLYLIILAAILSIGTFFRSLLMNSICEKVIADIREVVIRHLLKLPLSFFEQFKAGDIITRLTNDLNIVNNLVANLFSTALRNIIMIIGGIIMMIATNVKLAGLVFMVMPFIIIIIIGLSKKVRKLTKIYLQENSLVSAEIDETINAMSLIKFFGSHQQRANSFLKVSQQALATAIKRVKIRSSFFAATIILIFSAISLILWYGGSQVVKGQMQAGELSSFIFYAILVAASAGALAEIGTEFSKALISLSRVFEFLKYAPETEGEKAELINKMPIIFENVSFAYPSNPKTNIIEKFNLSIMPGEKIAIVGQSGSGKSTIFSLLLGLYVEYDGRIKLGNYDIKKIDLDQLRNYFAIVPQDTTIFSTTIADNIKIGYMSANNLQIIKAAQFAQLDQFIDGLPDKYQTYVGEKGLRLSGGQRQRIGIARAFLKNSSILLLDEATSNLDSENEQLIQQTIKELMKNKTTIIISHRLSSITKCDRIIVMDKGKIIDIGNHQYLLGNCELYRKLYQISDGKIK